MKKSETMSKNSFTQEGLPLKEGSVPEIFDFIKSDCQKEWIECFIILSNARAHIQKAHSFSDDSDEKKEILSMIESALKGMEFLGQEFQKLEEKSKIHLENVNRARRDFFVSGSDRVPVPAGQPDSGLQKNEEEKEDKPNQKFEESGKSDGSAVISAGDDQQNSLSDKEILKRLPPVDPATGLIIPVLQDGVKSFSRFGPINPDTGKEIALLKNKRSMKGRASKKNSKKINSILDSNFEVRTVLHDFPDEWYQEHPEAVSVDPFVQNELIKVPAMYVLIQHIYAQNKILAPVSENRDQPEEASAALDHCALCNESASENESSDSQKEEFETEIMNSQAAESENEGTSDTDSSNSIWITGWDDDGWMIVKKSERGRKKSDCRVKQVRAEGPVLWLPNCICSYSMIADILYRKYALFIPFYRQFEDYRIHKLYISTVNMWNWTKKAWETAFEHIFNRMLQKIRELNILHIDETTVYVLEVMETTDRENCYYIGVTSAKDEEVQLSVYCYRQTREGEYVKEILDENRKYKVHCDAYKSYFQEFLFVCICHDHNRRHFVKALEAEAGYQQYKILVEYGGDKDGSLEAFLNQPGNETLKDLVTIIDLYRILYNNEFNYRQENLSNNQRGEHRRLESKPVLDEIYKIIDKYSTSGIKKSLMEGKIYVPKDSAFGKAITYARNQKDGLYNYINDGDMEINNSLQERCFRPVKKLKDNCLFFDTEQGAEIGGGWLSVIQSCRMNEVNELLYIEYVLRNFNSEDPVCMEHIDDFLPCSPSLPDYLKTWSKEKPPVEWEVPEDEWERVLEASQKRNWRIPESVIRQREKNVRDIPMKIKEERLCQP